MANRLANRLHKYYIIYVLYNLPRARAHAVSYIHPAYEDSLYGVGLARLTNSPDQPFITHLGLTLFSKILSSQDLAS